MKCIKTLRGYAAHARFLAECKDTPLWLARGQVEEIPSPYRYSPTVRVLLYDARSIIIFETAHRRYEVFEVPTDMLTFATEQAAMNWHIRYSRDGNPNAFSI